jgi:glycogen synthase
MNVALVGPYPPPHGGVQTHLVALRCYLQQQGITVSVINVARHTGDSRPVGVHFPNSSIAVLRLLFRLRPEIIHCHVGGLLQPRVLGLLLATTLIPGARTVLTFHSGGYPSSPAGRRARPWTVTGLVLRRLDRLIGVNAEIARWFEALGIDKRRIQVISPFTRLSLEAVSAEALPPALDQFFRSHAPVLASVGLLEPEYDLDLQIDALAHVRETLPGAGLVIVGSGTLAHHLTDRVRSVGQGHILLTGDLPHATTLQVVRESDALLRTTRYDGDALSVNEALALGTPVIATNTGMRPDGATLIPIGDQSALIGAVLSAIRAGAPTRVAPESRDDAGSLASVLRTYQELCPGPAEVPAPVLEYPMRKHG